MKSKTILKVLGFTGTILGLLSTVVLDWSNEKQVEIMVEEKIKEALHDKEES